MWRPTWKGLLAHKLRLALTALAVVLGVSFVAGTYVFTDTIDAVFEELFATSVAGVDVYVRAPAPFEGSMGPDREPIPEELVDQIADVPGVAQVQPAVDGYAQLVGRDGEPIAPMAPTIGVSWGEAPLTPLVLREGREPRAANEVAIDAGTARTYGFELGERIQVITQAGPGSYTMVGIVGFGKADNLAGATLTAFTLAEAQRVFGLEGTVTEIGVAATEGVSPKELVARIQAALPGTYEVADANVVAAQQADAVGEQLGFLRIGLLVFAAVALFVGSFIIANTFAIVVAQRTREFALLRALGASGRQVTTAVLVEASIVGFLASGVGVALGVLVAVAIRALMRSFGVTMPGGGLVLQPRTIVVGLLLGTVVTLLAALLPARRAARIPPVAALRIADVAVREPSRRRLLTGTITLSVSALLMALGLAAVLPNPPISPAIAVGIGVLGVFVGVSLLAPLIAPLAARIIGAAGARFGIPGRLARENAAANPRRTAATASALMIGLALVGFVATFGSSLERSAVGAIEEELRADFVLQGPQSNIGLGFSPNVGRTLMTLPEVGAVTRLRIGMYRDSIDAGSSVLTSFDPESVTDVAAFELQAGSLDNADANSVYLEAEAAAARGYTVGDAIPMVFARSGEQQMRLAGVFTKTRIFDTTFLLPNVAYERHFRTVLDYTVMVRVAEGVPLARALQAIEAVTADAPGVRVENQAQFRETQRAQINQILGLVTALLLLAVIIALLGITNTLALSVFERTREIGLLRAVGMSRRQVRAMIRWEAFLVAIFGAALGVTMGAVFGWAVVRALADEGIDQLSLPWGQFVAGVLAAGLAGVLAGVLPARRAAKLDVLDAVASS